MIIDENILFLSIGSNIDPIRNIRKSLPLINEQLPLISISKIYQSPAVGDPDAPNFLNLAVMCKSSLDPSHIKFNILREIEKKIGRKRLTNKNKPREIDIDICYYGSRIVDSEKLTIPDPLASMVDYIAIPMAELSPNFKHPITHERLIDIQNEIVENNLKEIQDEILIRTIQDLVG